MRTAIVDRWGYILLLAGCAPTARDGTKFDKYAICEREYLRFIHCANNSSATPSIARVLDDISRTVGVRTPPGDLYPTLLAPTQVSMLHGIELEFHRLETDSVGYLPDFQSRYGITISDAENILASRLSGMPLLICTTGWPPAAWKARFHNQCKHYELNHSCPSLNIPTNWYSSPDNQP